MLEYLTPWESSASGSLRFPRLMIAKPYTCSLLGIDAVLVEVSGTVNSEREEPF